MINFFLKKEFKKKLLVSYLTINLLYLLIGSYIYFTEKIIAGFHYKEFSIGLKYLFIANIVVFIAIIIKKWRNKDLRKPIYIGIMLCTIFAIISAIFAYDINIALEGCWERYEGLFSVLYYLSIMLLSTFVAEKYKKFIVNIILVCGAIQAIYAICQCFSLFNVKQIFHYRPQWDERIQGNVPVGEIWALGFTNNPNFFGTYMLLVLSYSLGLLVDSKKNYQNIIYSSLIALFMFALLISNSSASAVGLLFVIIYIFIYCLKIKSYNKFIVILSIMLAITCLTVKLGKTTLAKDMLQIGNEATEIAKGNFNENYGTERMYIWKETIKIVPNYLLHGVGIDNFHKAFNGGALILKRPTREILYDKAHNEYLQILVTQGIFALASYLFVYGYVVYKGTKNAFKNNEIYLILPIIGYLVQAFFSISVIEVAPIFYMLLGLCCGEEKDI